MKLFSWMQNKLNGKQGNKKPHTASTSNHVKQEPREEFNDWPHGLLAIGTFGNNDLKENLESQNSQDDPSSSEEVLDFTPEEVGKLQKELTKLLSRKPNKEKEVADLPLDRFLNCPSSLEVDRRISNALCSESGRMAPLMSFYWFMSFAFAILGIFWFSQYARYWREALQLQNCLTLVITLGMFEMTIWYLRKYTYNRELLLG